MATYRVMSPSRRRVVVRTTHISFLNGYGVLERRWRAFVGALSTGGRDEVQAYNRVLAELDRANTEVNRG